MYLSKSIERHSGNLVTVRGVVVAAEETCADTDASPLHSDGEILLSTYDKIIAARVQIRYRKEDARDKHGEKK